MNRYGQADPLCAIGGDGVRDTKELCEAALGEEEGVNLGRHLDCKW